jgi:mannose-1-phosphate guanylyltransferase
MPTQFRAPSGEEPLLLQALRRASRITPSQKTLAVVSAGHKTWWKDLLAGLPPENVLVQPTNRGTAAAILLPYVHILQRDPDPLIVFLPCDRHASNEHDLGNAISSAVGITARAPYRSVVLGLVPGTMDEDRGWIVVSTPYRDGPAWNVRDFAENPDPWTAQRLAANGALVSSMILATTRKAISLLFARALPHLVLRFMDWKEEDGMTEQGLWRLYGSLQPHDFSSHVLPMCVDLILALPVDGTGDST